MISLEEELVQVNKKLQELIDMTGTAYWSDFPKEEVGLVVDQIRYLTGYRDALQQRVPLAQ